MNCEQIENLGFWVGKVIRNKFFIFLLDMFKLECPTNKGTVKSI